MYKLYIWLGACGDAAVDMDGCVSDLLKEIASAVKAEEFSPTPQCLHAVIWNPDGDQIVDVQF